MSERDPRGGRTLVRVVADPHRDWSRIGSAARRAAEEGVDELWIAGDVGLGRRAPDRLPFSATVPIRMIRGNHDRPNLDPGWPDFHVMPDGEFYAGCLFIGGADSSSFVPYRKRHRYEKRAVSWESIERAIEAIEKHGPPLAVVSHDMPESVYQARGMAPFPWSDSPRLLEELRQYMRSRFMAPEFWLYGHHHCSHVHTAEGTLFRGLASLYREDWFDLESLDALAAKEMG